MTSTRPPRLRAAWRSIALLSMGAVVLSLAPAAWAAGWVREGVEDGITIYNREKEGSDIKEVKAIGYFDAPPWVVKNVIDDVGNYRKFMPYTEKSTIIKREKNAVVTYQYLDTPIVSDRDYTIRIREKSFKKPDGTVVYKMAWSPANHLGPKPGDAVRVTINDGYWQLEPEKNGKRTKATYYLYTDPGGSIPTFMKNKANFTAIPGLYSAIKGRLKMPQYNKEKFVFPEDKKAAPAPAP